MKKTILTLFILMNFTNAKSEEITGKEYCKTQYESQVFVGGVTGAVYGAAAGLLIAPPATVIAGAVIGGVSGTSLGVVTDNQKKCLKELN